MNRKLFGKNGAILTVAVALLLATGVSCSDSIPGKPDMVLQEYVVAVQKGDFETIYRLNRATARQSRFIHKDKTGDAEKMDAENMAMARANYEAVQPSFTPGMHWAEKHFFPQTSGVFIGRPQHLAPTGNEPGLKDNYEKGNTVVIPVSVTYPDLNQAPEYGGKKIKQAEYRCVMGKVRMEDSLMIYTHDDKWFFNACLIEIEKIEYR